MDTNKQDYMNFMSAEFDRLDPAGKIFTSFRN